MRVEDMVSCRLLGWTFGNSYTVFGDIYHYGGDVMVNLERIEILDNHFGDIYLDKRDFPSLIEVEGRKIILGKKLQYGDLEV